MSPVGWETQPVDGSGPTGLAVADPGAQPPLFDLPEPYATMVAERPELLVGAAFAAGFLLAQILKILAR